MKQFRIIGRVKLILLLLSSPISSFVYGGRSHLGIAGRQYNRPLSLQFVNKYNDCDLNAYVTGVNPEGDVVFLTTLGTWFYPAPKNGSIPTRVADTDITIPIPYLANETGRISLTVPDDISAGRVWIARGQLKFFASRSANGTMMLQEPSAADPEDASKTIDWGFIELTYTKMSGLFANLSFVDFVGLSLSMILTLSNGEVQIVKGLASNAVEKVCDALQKQSKLDRMPWNQLCVYSAQGSPLRILSPNIYETVNPGSMDGYYTDYINRVWELYATEDLIFDNSANQSIKCRIDHNETLNCEGDNRPYNRPTTADVWGCNTGPFAIVESDNAIHRAVVPRLCAAFVRTTLLLDGGEVQPSLPNTSYYLSGPTNHYSRIVHENELDGKGYTFPYDDVTLGQENAAGIVAGSRPLSLEILIGGDGGL